VLGITGGVMWLERRRRRSPRGKTPVDRARESA
jgi:hypothetical protein